MDILNAIYLKNNGLLKTNAEPNSVIHVSVPDIRRDDKYITIGVPIEYMAAVIGALQTVAVDGVTITGDGTPGNPLTVNVAGLGVVISVTDDGLGGVSVDNTDPSNPIISFTGVEIDPVTLSGNGTSTTPLAVNPGFYTTAPTVAPAFTQSEFASDPVISVAPVGQLVIVTNYNTSGFGASFIRVVQTTNTFADWVVLSTDSLIASGGIGANPL